MAPIMDIDDAIYSAKQVRIILNPDLICTRNPVKAYSVTVCGGTMNSTPVTMLDLFLPSPTGVIDIHLRSYCTYNFSITTKCIHL